MPIVNCDVKSLENVVAAELSQDKVMMTEIREKQDLHSNNQRAFGLPTRGVAKTLVFRILYGGGAYSFSQDPDFTHVSKSVKYWENAIEAFYAKYQGIKEWHERLIHTAQTDGVLQIPSGRQFPITPVVNKWKGSLDWPITVIKNYPVQGFGADLVMLARLEASKRLKASGLEYKLISTIHDSIVADCPSDCSHAVGRILFDSIEYVPTLCKQVFGYDFSLPLTSEVQYGPNKKEMVDMKFD